MSQRQFQSASNPPMAIPRAKPRLTAMRRAAKPVARWSEGRRSEMIGDAAGGERAAPKTGRAGKGTENPARGAEAQGHRGDPPAERASQARPARPQPAGKQ